MKQELRKAQTRELEAIIADGKRKSAEIRRAQAVLLLGKGVDVGIVLTTTRLSKSRIFAIYAAYMKKGASALKDKRQGKPKELLKKKQRDEIIEIVKTKMPNDLGINAPFWTTGILGRWIEQQYDVTYKSKTSLYLVFRKASFTYHKPERRYHEHNEKEVRAWRRKVKSTIKQHLDDPKTVVLAADEMILTTRTTTQKVWLPSGEAPYVEVSNSSIERRQVYGFLNLKDGTEHAFKAIKQNMHVTAEILKQVRALYPEQKIVLIWDNAGWHRGSVVMEFVTQDGHIEVIHFPKYAPEENPQEHVWKRGRSEVTHNHFIEDIDKATDEFVSFLNGTKFPYSILGFCPVS